MSGRLSAGKRSAINNLKLADAAKIARKTQAPELQSQPKRLKEDQELLDLRAQNLHLTAANSALKIENTELKWLNAKLGRELKKARRHRWPVFVNTTWINEDFFFCRFMFCCFKTGFIPHYTTNTTASYQHWSIKMEHDAAKKNPGWFVWCLKTPWTSVIQLGNIYACMCAMNICTLRIVVLMKTARTETITMYTYHTHTHKYLNIQWFL